jgi:hypothetical protein
MLQKLSALADAKSLRNVLDCFREEIRVSVLEEHGKDIHATLRALKNYVGADDELRVMERQMDTSYFNDLFENAGVRLQGTDRNGRAILWFKAVKGFQKLSRGSPQAKAFLRFILWCREYATMMSFPSMPNYIVILDDSSRGLLDFNISVLHSLGCMMARRFPATYYVMHVCGVHPLILTPWNTVLRVYPDAGRFLVLLRDKRDIHTMVEDERDIPEWLDGTSTPEDADRGRQQVGDWERCLQKGRTTITAREIYNPEGAVEPVQQVLQRSPRHAQAVRSLDVIEEEAESDAQI